MNNGGDLGSTTVTFIITTARSGTQWLHASLDRLYSEVLRAEHEVLQYQYEPRQFLRSDDLDAIRAIPAIAMHFDQIHATLESRSYIETGFPAFALAPLLVREFGDRLKLLQFVRHPVRVAASIVTHGWFDNQRRPDIAKSIAPQPSDPGVAWPQFASRWSTMTPFECGLYYWSEVHLFGLEMQGKFPEVPFFRLRFEDLLSDLTTQQDFSEFLGVGSGSDWGQVVNKPIDNYHRRTDERIDVSLVNRHPEVVALARKLGYECDSVSSWRISARYQIPLQRRLRACLGRNARAILAWVRAICG